MRRFALVLVAVAGAGGCARDSNGTLDAPIDYPTDNSPAHVTNFPDGYANVASKCDGAGHRIFATRDGLLFVVVDERCREDA